MPGQNAADKLGIGDGTRIVAMDAERRDSPLVHQPNDLGFDLGRVVKHRIGFAPRHERAVIAVAPIGEALGEYRPRSREAAIRSSKLPGLSDQR